MVSTLKMQPKKCQDFVFNFLKVSAPKNQPKKCPDFVCNLLKVSSLKIEYVWILGFTY